MSDSVMRAAVKRRNQWAAIAIWAESEGEKNETSTPIHVLDMDETETNGQTWDTVAASM